MKCTWVKVAGILGPMIIRNVLMKMNWCDFYAFLYAYYDLVFWGVKFHTRYLIILFHELSRCHTSQVSLRLLPES